MTACSYDSATVTITALPTVGAGRREEQGEEEEEEERAHANSEVCR